MSELLLVGAGMMGSAYLPAARRLGARVRLIETGRHFQRLRAEADEAYEGPSSLEEAWAQTAYALAVERPPDGVLAFNENQVIAAALLQDRLGLPGPSLHAAVISRNKALQRACFAAHDLPQPEYLLTDDLSTAAGWALPRLPIVVKPPSGAGSLGVEQVCDPETYNAVAARRAGDGRLLLETAVSGPEFSWEGLVRDRRIVFDNVTEKETTGPPSFIEISHRAGHRFADTLLAKRVSQFLERVVAALDVVTGIVHLEFRISDAGPVLIEIAVRTPGDYIMDVLSLTYGVDMHEAVVRLALGHEVQIRPGIRPKAYAASFMVLGEPGRLLDVEGLDEVREHPLVVRARIRRKPGDVVPRLRSSDDRVGHVLICADSREQRDSALSFVRNKLRVITERDGD